MKFWVTVLKLLLMIALVVLVAAPFLAEYLSFRKDRKKKMSYKRFRIVLFTVFYAIAVTVALVFLTKLINWIGSFSLIQWLSARVSFSGRLPYMVKVLAIFAINFLIGGLFWLLSRPVRLGLKKKNLLIPKKKDGTFSWAQKAERAVLRFFHTETWFFVARILKWFAALLSASYAVVFFFYLLPAIFGAKWIPYDFISTQLLSAGYIYPVITLLVLWEGWFFLEGIRRLEEECPELLFEEKGDVKKLDVDLQDIDTEIRREFAGFFACEVSSGEEKEEIATTHHEITNFIAQAVENDSRNPQKAKEVYLGCMDQIIESGGNALISGSFFSEFSMYFLRYLSMIVARGDNIVLVCNNDTQIEEVYNYVNQGLTEISSLYCRGFGADAVDFDDPIWRVVKISGDHDVIDEATIDDNSILITTLNYLCSNHFENQHSKFIHLIDTIVFVDTLETVNSYSRQMSILNDRLLHITRTNSLLAKDGNKNENFRVRYMSRPVRYVFFDDTKTSGLDKVLKNMLSVEFGSVDAMNFNARTMLRCYNYEGAIDENGRRSYKQFFRSDEEIGAVMNIAVLSLARGAGNVSVFVDEAIPYGNIEETIAANKGQLAIAADGSNLRVNKYQYNPDKYSVILAVDADDNLPAALRRYASLVSDKPTMVAVFSRPYLLRDYYVANIDELWRGAQMARIPAHEERLFNLQDEQAARRAAAQRILVKANAGGIAEEEIWHLCEGVPGLEAAARLKDTNAILRAVLKEYGFSQSDLLDLFKHFEYVSVKDFDENGQYVSQDKVLLRRHGQLFDMINGRDVVVMMTGDKEIPLSVPKNRLTQNFIVDQNVLYNGNVYYIHKIDTEKGRIYARLAVSGKNDEAYQYVQDREYRIEWPAQDVEYICPPKHVVLGREQDGVAVSDVYVSAFRANTEVVTSGYFEVDPHTMSVNYKRPEYHSINDEGNDVLAKQTYRRYGVLSAPTYSADSIIRDTKLVAYDKGALVMSVRMTGQFGSDVNRTATLAAMMLSEILHSMFPSTADALVVSPVIHGELKDDEMQTALKCQPKVTLLGREDEGNDFELLIIEDSETDLGVVSVLLSAGDDILNTLFAPIHEYLKWYAAAEKKSEYLYYGLDHEPACFDFESLRVLSELVGDDQHDVEFAELEQFVKYECCDFCGKRFVGGEDLVELDDGRRMCADCAANLVGNNKKILKAHLERAKMFLENTYGILLEDDYDVCFASTLKIANTLKQHRDIKRRGADVPLKSYVDDKQKIHAENDIPSVNLSELLVRELTHVWQLRHLPELAEELAEGHIALVSLQYLRFVGQQALATVRSSYYETTGNLSGVGYRRLVQELLANPQFNNNPFRYLLEADGQSGDGVITPPTPHVIEEGEYGDDYTGDGLDRLPTGEVPFFYRERLNPNLQGVYNMLLAAVKAHAESVDVPGCSFDEACKVVDAIQYDHPELYYFRTISMRGSEVLPVYGATADEVAAINARIEEVVPKYLEGITDTMSAYDVALRLHAKMIASVDYDTIALNRETAQGGPEREKIDPLRSITGVFLDGKAVCEGYARAVQYLLQRCGIECAEAAGNLHRQGGGAHAWNIIKIDGEYYYLDVTWDDSSDTVQAVKSNDLGFDYFCITSEELSRTRDLAYCPVPMPECTATKANYYHHNGLVLDAWNGDKVKAFAVAAAEKGNKSFTFKCASKAAFDEAFRRLCVEYDAGYEALKAAAKKNKKLRTDAFSYSYNNDLWTITVKFQYK